MSEEEALTMLQRAAANRAVARDEYRRAVAKAHTAGWSCVRIAAALGVGKSTVHRVVQETRENESVK
ncbi:hypothetical protein BST28_17530 [Mycolicibacter kumamotonensis]|uniref:Helix-turn-helix domain-containing protein n=1 Tax=Mycolicibacter kumamotonensis TaxID=354243 RepID=A0A1X0DYQ0_9MYCO|nr:helix-turn-helix domain-containing protein [Mycolicibacter kumamotonensis]ORA77604.1 hypothetical protein BST28_17530 [Mycolicibacter kumamotonensis]